MPSVRPIRVLSERIMTRGFEPTVQRLMENVQSVVRKQPGLLSLETLSDVNDHHKYVVLSEWKSKKDYDAWVNSEDFKKCTDKINEVLDVPGKRTTIYQPPKEDIFLLRTQTPHSQICAKLHSVMKGKIRVISERIMTRGYEPTVARLMESVKTKVRAQPGLLSVATYNQIDDQHKYVVFSEWRSKDDYDAWVNSADFKEVSRKINEVLDVPTMKTRVFRTPNEDIFLL